MWIRNSAFFKAVKIEEAKQLEQLVSSIPILQVLQYLARAYYKAGKMKEAKATLLKARRVAPQVVRWREVQYQIFYCGDLLLDTSLIRILRPGYFLAILSMPEQCFATLVQ